MHGNMVFSRDSIFPTTQQSGCLCVCRVGRARSLRNGRLSTFVHSGLDVPSGIRRTVIRTTQRHGGGYGLPMHHPRFLEWIGIPQSASLLEIGGAWWLDNLLRDQAITAAVHLQRDVGLMSKIIELCLSTRDFPAEEVAAGALGPRVRHASVQMEAMGLWRPSLDPLRLH